MTEQQNQELQNVNKRILAEGLLDPDLPPIGFGEEVWKAICDILDDLVSDYDEFYQYEDDIIQSFKSIDSTAYIHNDGTESISYYNYKNNNTLREMQIPNLILYSAFVHNTMKYYAPLFLRLYFNDDNSDLISHSTSYILLGKEFYNPTMQYGEIPLMRRFSVKNIRWMSNITFDSNQFRMLD